MIAPHYRAMLGAKSVIREISEWSTARGKEIGYDNVFDYSLGNPSVPCPDAFTAACKDLLDTVDPVTLHGYTPTLTLPEVRAAVAESLNRRFGMDYTAARAALEKTRLLADRRGGGSDSGADEMGVYHREVLRFAGFLSHRSSSRIIS